MGLYHSLVVALSVPPSPPTASASPVVFQAALVTTCSQHTEETY